MAVVYLHRRKDNNEVFYVGIGNDIKRAFDTKNRKNKHWKNIVNLCNNVFKVELLFDNITKEEAIKKEIEFIKLSILKISFTFI
jgi:predicted GIY-YIG superfamily endonuclease